MNELDRKAGSLDFSKDVLDHREIVGLQPLREPGVGNADPQARIVLRNEMSGSKPGLERVRVHTRLDLAEHSVPDIPIGNMLHEPLPPGAYSFTGFPQVWKKCVISIRIKVFLLQRVGRMVGRKLPQMRTSRAFSSVTHRHTHGHDEWEAQTWDCDFPNLDDRPVARLPQRVNEFQRRVTGCS